MQKRLFLTLIITVLSLSLLSALTLAEGESAQSLHLDIFANPTQITAPGDVITLTYQLFDNTITGTDVIFYAPIPEDTRFVNVQNAVPQTYTIGVLSAFTGMQAQTAIIPPADVKSIIWTGVFTGPRYITLTVESLTGRGTVAEAALINNVTHVTAMTDTLKINGKQYLVFLPLVGKDYTAPTPPPTVQPTPQPTATPDPSGTVLTPTVLMWMQASLFAGRAPKLNQAINAFQSNACFGSDCLTDIGRGGFTVDTRSFSSISSATLTFRVQGTNIYEPKDYGLVLEKSNWSYLDLPEYDPNVIPSITEAQWNGVVSGPVALIDASEVGVEKTVTIPVSLLTPGDFSHIRIRLNKEGLLTQNTLLTGAERIDFYILELNIKE